MPEQLVVRFANAKGAPAPCDVLFTTNQRTFPVWSEWKAVGPCEQAVRIPKEQPFGVAALWEVPGFGQIIVTADNEGQYYRLGSQPIDFRQEAAKSKVKKVCDQARALGAAGYALSTALHDRVGRASHALAQAQQTEGEAAARWADEALKEAFWAGEELELAKARTDISRMSAERRRSLLFGASYFSHDVSPHFKQRFVELFNFATLPFYRTRFEAEEGKVNWALPNSLLDWLDLRGIKAKGHPLTWYKTSGMPPWMLRLGFSSMMELVYQQIYDTVSYYKDRIKIWDIINEAHNPESNLLQYTHEQMIEATAVASRAVHDADPTAIRIVNTNRPWCYYRAFFENTNPMHAFEYLEALDQAGVEYDAVGLQMYHGGGYHWVRDMADISAWLNLFASLGKPIHITEVQTPSCIERGGGAKNRPDREVATSGWWHHPWDLETQADWVEQYYTIAIANPAVEAITWWNLSDRATFWPYGGFLDSLDQPKPSFWRLKRLLEDVRRG